MNNKNNFNILEVIPNGTTLIADTICRICLRPTANMHSIFETVVTEVESPISPKTSKSVIILGLFNDFIQLETYDEFSNMICATCVQAAKEAYVFRTKVKNVEEWLQQNVPQFKMAKCKGRKARDVNKEIISTQLNELSKIDDKNTDTSNKKTKTSDDSSDTSKKKSSVSKEANQKTVQTRIYMIKLAKQEPSASLKNAPIMKKFVSNNKILGQKTDEDIQRFIKLNPSLFQLGQKNSAVKLDNSIKLKGIRQYGNLNKVDSLVKIGSANTSLGGVKSSVNSEIAQNSGLLKTALTAVKPKGPESSVAPKSAESPQLKSAESSQLKSAESSQLKSVESSQLKSAESSQLKSAESSQLKSAESSQLKSAGSSQLKSAESSQLKSAEMSQLKSAEIPGTSIGSKRALTLESFENFEALQNAKNSDLESYNSSVTLQSSKHSITSKSIRSLSTWKMPEYFKSSESTKTSKFQNFKNSVKLKSPINTVNSKISKNNIRLINIKRAGTSAKPKSAETSENLKRAETSGSSKSTETSEHMENSGNLNSTETLITDKTANSVTDGTANSVTDKTADSAGSAEVSVNSEDFESLANISDISSENSLNDQEDNDPKQATQNETELKNTDYNKIIAPSIIIKKFEIPESLQEHDYGVIYCAVCGEYFSSKDLYKEHVQIHNERRIKCNVCDKLFTKPTRYNQHVKIHEKPPNFNPNLTQRFYYPFTMNSQRKRFIDCEICGKRCPQLAGVIKHMRVHHVKTHNYGCFICLQGFKNQKTYFDHLKTHIVEFPYSCAHCSQKFKTIRDITSHVKTHYPEQLAISKTKKVEPTKDLKPYLCPYCGNSYRFICTLTTHVRTHTNEKSDLCQICGKTFISKTHLNSHMNTHLDVSFPCEICDKKYRQKSMLKSHMQVHFGYTILPCQICGKKFKGRKNLRSHMKVHSSEMNFICVVCGLQFRTKTDMQRHLNNHLNRKFYTCKYCGKEFQLKQEFKKHEDRHEGSYPFTCSFCGIGFNFAAALTRHLTRCPKKEIN